MESGLDGRNNRPLAENVACATIGLNGVRPRWPEQSGLRVEGLYESLVVSMESGLDGRNNVHTIIFDEFILEVSMESGLDGRNNAMLRNSFGLGIFSSQWSPA